MVSSAKPIKLLLFLGREKPDFRRFEFVGRTHLRMYHVCEGGSISFVRPKGPKDCWRS